MSAHTETYVAPPSALHYMLQAFRPSSGWNPDRGFPDLNVTWRDYHIEPQVMQFLQLINGIQDPRSQELLSLPFPHVTGFRLLMTMLTHPLWPLPIRGCATGAQSAVDAPPLKGWRYERSHRPGGRMART